MVGKAKQAEKNTIERAGTDLARRLTLTTGIESNPRPKLYPKPAFS